MAVVAKSKSTLRKNQCDFNKDKCDFSCINLPLTAKYTSEKLITK